MSKVSKQPPKKWVGPVRVNSAHYQLWALMPVKLGEIFRKGNYWMLNDNMRFISAREAAEYLATTISVMPAGPAKPADKPVKPTSSGAGAQGATIKETKVLGQGKWARRLSADKPNLAVDDKLARINKLIAEVNQLKEELISEPS